MIATAVDDVMHGHVQMNLPVLINLNRYRSISSLTSLTTVGMD